MAEQVKQKNSFLKSKARVKVTFSASPLGFLVAACGGGGGGESSSDTNSSTITTTTSTTGSNNFGSNSNGLDAFVAGSINNFSGGYSASDQLSLPVVDQSQSENYLTGYNDKTALVSLTGKNEIDGLLYEYWNDPTKADFW